MPPGRSVNEEVPGIFDDIPTLIGRASCVLLGLNIISEVITGKVGLLLYLSNTFASKKNAHVSKMDA